MTNQEIFDRVRTRFPDAVDHAVTDQAGDPFLIVKKGFIRDVCLYLRDDPDLNFDMADCISGVDDATNFWVVYHLYSIKKNHTVVLKVSLDRENPSIQSVMHLWPTADWQEREIYDMFGIHFEGHSDLRRILLPEDWEGHPLRKDYFFPEEYQGIILR
jgi:NADH-quinone oxidoreductase subunit C